jgi:hypothetical protein
MLKKLSEELKRDHRALIFILFGYGNNAESLSQYINSLELNRENIRVGIVQSPSRDQKEEYYSLFRLDYDSRLMILDRNRSVTYMERAGDNVDSSFVLAKMGSN